MIQTRPSFTTVVNDEPEIAKLLIKNRAKLDVTDLDEKTPLQCANDNEMKNIARCGGEEIVASGPGGCGKQSYGQLGPDE